jgi:hypothetical protein
VPDFDVPPGPKDAGALGLDYIRTTPAGQLLALPPFDTDPSNSHAIAVVEEFLSSFPPS